MKFARNIFLLLTLILLLSGALVLTRIYKPTDAPVPGALLYPLKPESVISITWDVTGPDGKACLARLARRGEFWEMAHPFPGARCDRAAVADLLDAVSRMRILSQLGKVEATAFTPERYLTLETPDRKVTCAFGEVLPMELSRTLVESRGALVAVEAAHVARLPKRASDLRTRAILPVSPDRIRQLEWRGPDQPFTRARCTAGGAWSVLLPFPFEPKAERVTEALAALTDPQTIAAYVRPADTAPTATLPEVVHSLATESELAVYGLDEERALRLTVLARGVRDGFSLRFGKEDPTRPDHVFCLLDGYQAVVSVPAALREIFGTPGPFVTNFRDLPVLGESVDADFLRIQSAAGETQVELTKQAGAWSLVRPTALPAEGPAVRELLESLAALTGDLADTAAASGPPLLELTLGPAEQPEKQKQLAVYGTAADPRLAVRRKDLGRVYLVDRTALPEILLQPNPDRKLINRTILSLPAETIRRIAVLHRDGTSVAVRRRSDALGWETETPVGAYINEEVLDEWLTRLAELKAVEVLQETPGTFASLQPHGLDIPYLRLSLDLTGGEEGLRKILLIGSIDPETGSAPAMVQGRPVLYRLDEEDLAVFRLLPAQQEALD